MVEPVPRHTRPDAALFGPSLGHIGTGTLDAPVVEAGFEAFVESGVNVYWFGEDGLTLHGVEGLEDLHRRCHGALCGAAHDGGGHAEESNASSDEVRGAERRQEGRATAVVDRLDDRRHHL